MHMMKERKNDEVEMHQPRVNRQQNPYFDIMKENRVPQKEQLRVRPSGDCCVFFLQTRFRNNNFFHWQPQWSLSTPTTAIYYLHTDTMYPMRLIVGSYEQPQSINLSRLISTCNNQTEQPYHPSLSKQQHSLRQLRILHVLKNVNFINYKNERHMHDILYKYHRRFLPSPFLV